MNYFIIEFPEGFSVRDNYGDVQKEICFFDKKRFKRGTIEEMIYKLSAAPEEIARAYKEGYQEGKYDGEHNREEEI